MSSVNKVILVGHLGRDPEMRTFPNGDQIANVTIATSEKWKDKQSGEPREHTEWHRLLFNGKLAEIAGKWLRKGSLIYIEGSLRTRKWEQDGQTRYATEIRVDNMQMLGGKPNDGGRNESAAQSQASRRQDSAPPATTQGTLKPGAGGGSGFDDLDDDIPF